MSFHLPFGNLTDCELLSFIKDRDIPPFSQYSHLVFQPLISPDGHDEIYNPDCQIDTYNNIFGCLYFDIDNKDFEKNILRRHQIHN